MSDAPDPELRALYAADQQDRSRRVRASLSRRDDERRRRAEELIDAGALRTGEDHFHAAMLFQHGRELSCYWRAHELARRAAELGDERGKWLSAAAYDRWLMHQGKPQRYGTQYRQTMEGWELCAVDPGTTDEERAELNVPPLAEARRRAERMAPRTPPPAPAEASRPWPVAPLPARAVVAVASGKGGVGKSTVSLNLALALAGQGASVGLLDADVYGPDIPVMINLTRKVWLESWTLWRRPVGQGAERLERLEPLERYGLKVMSTGFLIAEDQPLTWWSEMADHLLYQLLYGVDWGELDYLVVDLPPGTADLQQRVAGSIPLSGVVLVVTPQEAAHLDAKKVLSMFRTARVPILGAVENMSGVTCPCCGNCTEVFPTVDEDRSIWAMGVERLAQLPLDPALAAAGDYGPPLVVSQPESWQADAFRRLAGAVVQALAVAQPSDPPTPARARDAGDH